MTRTAASLADLRQVGAADVYKGGTLAARLERADDGAVSFVYRPEYAGPPVATTLPLGEAPVRTPGGGLPAFFAGLLPEGHRLTVLRRAARTSPDDELTLLLAVGADTPGDVRVVPAGEPPRTLPSAASGPIGELDVAALADAVDLHALPGVQRKASAVMLTRPLRLGQRDAILKLDPPEYPGLVRNEAAHLLAARSMKLPTAHAEIVRDRRGADGLLVERFDRATVDGRPVRRAMEDAAQLLGILPAAKYRVSAEEIAVSVVEVCRARPVAARNVFLQFLFAWLTGNGDLHAKNISVLRDGEGVWRVAPVYDVLSTAPYPDLDLDLAVPLSGRTSRLRWRHWTEFADAIGLPQTAVPAAARTATVAAGRIDLAELGYTGSPLNRAERELRHRRAELPDHIAA
ncbi:type II toxin-antitoxin system HipA family toxin [Zhihengliuella alba]|uniref:Type II toxin-antitoxin system HipA family toxin n=1 Tax=Zhihengliuella alba TaxID=547018 RepID=A0ABP7DLW7_9MICC